MYFSKLSEYFQKLEATASRNSMVEILARLLSEAEAGEIDKIVYLTQGRVAPLYEPVEFQMAEQTVLKAFGQAYKTSIEKVTADYKKTGDLGVVAQELSKNQESGHACRQAGIKNYAKMTVEEVFNKLFEIARTSGEGSVEKKVSLLADLLKNSDPLSARYLARIPVDKMRLGFSDMTVLEGLSWMVCGSKKLKDKFEAAYNVRPDLGTLAVSVKRLGVSGAEKIEPKVGTPILSMRAERLPDAAGILEKMNGQCAVEPKIDGLRTQLHFKKNYELSSKNYAKDEKSIIHNSRFIIQLFSRGLENVTRMYPDLVKAAKQELSGVEEIILDGEAIGYDPKTGKYLPFQETVTRKRKHQVDLFSQSVPIKLICFDVLYLNGKSLLNESYIERRKILEKVLGHSGATRSAAIESPKETLSAFGLQGDRKGTILASGFALTRMTIVKTPEELKKIFEENIKQGLEGIMAKKLDGIYQAGARGWNWIKLKNSYTGSLADTIDAVVMGYDFGQGKRNKFGVGAFLIGVYDQKNNSFKTISKVGTGLTDEEWRTLAVSGKQLAVSQKPANYEVNKLMNCDVWVKPKLVGVFRADQITKSPMHTAGYALRFPRLDYWRTDKKPEDATSLNEILRMVNLRK
jgi:DNA ligase-1